MYKVEFAIVLAIGPEGGWTEAEIIANYPASRMKTSSPASPMRATAGSRP